MVTQTIRLVLGDQLDRELSALQDLGPNDLVLMAEVREEATYVKHHKKKIAFLFSAMRHFAQALKDDGIIVRYRSYDCPNNQGSLLGELRELIEELQPERVVVTHPGEYRLLKSMQQWSSQLKVEVEIREDSRFYASLGEFEQWAQGRKTLRMEYFYRQMRQQHRILVDDKQPTGGQWNYDTENRESPPADLKPPIALGFKPDTTTQAVLELVESEFADHFGELLPFKFGVTRAQALQVLEYFIKTRLAEFGRFQDAMVTDEPWMYHSLISFYLNCGLLRPQEAVDAALAAYEQQQAPLNSVEGFVRQILGWREFIRGFYWLKMPELKHANTLNAKRKLPELYWGGATKMNCLQQCVAATKQHAYAHHIQRLMVLGNFALLAGLDPDEVNEWYLIVYADAYEWVELPNVSAMVLFADGGGLASKPYAASGRYINTMSDYCKTCEYKVAQRTGPKACPFNALYWDFVARNQDLLAHNARMGLILKNWARMKSTTQAELLAQAQDFLQRLDAGEAV